MIALWFYIYPSTKEPERDKDRSSSGKDGTLVGNPTWVAGKKGYGLELDGTGDQIDVNNFKGITGTNPISVALWFKSTYNNATSQQSIVSWGTNTGSLRYTLNFDGAMVRLDNGGGAAKTTNSYADGLWHHLVAVKPNNGNIQSVQFYVDGSLAPRYWYGFYFQHCGYCEFQQGADKTNNRINFIGTLDDFRLYNKG